MSYLLTENMVNTAVIYVILKKIMTPFEEWDAYKLGIIDKDGNKIKTPFSSKERDSWDMLNKFVCNFKKIINKFVGKANFYTYFTMAYLLKDSVDYFYIQHNQKILNERYLKDFTLIKQNYIYDLIKQMEKDFGKEKINESNVEMLLIKYQDIFEEYIEEDLVL